MIVQSKCSVLFVMVSPFSDVLSAIISPQSTIQSQHRGIVVHPLKRVAGTWKCVSLTAEVLDCSFTIAVGGRDDVECTPMLLTAVESQLSEVQVRPQPTQTAGSDTHILTVVVIIDLVV